MDGCTVKNVSNQGISYIFDQLSLGLLDYLIRFQWLKVTVTRVGYHSHLYLHLEFCTGLLTFGLLRGEKQLVSPIFYLAVIEPLQDKIRQQDLSKM